MKEKDSFVFAVRQASGQSQMAFAERLGVGLRSLKRYELEGTLPSGKAAVRALEALAGEYGVTPPKTDN